MTAFTYRANLAAAEFPFLSDLQGRNVIIPTIDQNFSRQVNSPKDKDRDIGIPQVYYCHNVIPTDAGMAAVGYLGIAVAPADTDNTFARIYSIRDSSGNRAYLANTVTGRNYVLLVGTNQWVRTTDVTPAAGCTITVAYVNGVTYIYFGKTGCYKYNFATNTLDAVSLTALTAANILGVCAANGYMIAWTATAITWSSSVDPTDFTPSLVTGAGGGSVQLAKGKITFCSPNSYGFIAYTEVNALSFVYTGNGQYPFNNKEVLGCGGLNSFTNLAYDGNNVSQYAYTTAGLQEISGSGQSGIAFPELTDFLAGSTFEDFNETTFQLISTALGSPMQKAITMISNRYIVISYGVNSLTHTLIYDTGLRRWGKLRIDHVACFEYQPINPSAVETPRRSIGFLQADGTVKVVIMSYDTSLSAGVLICGKYQLDRAHYITLSEVHLENVKAGNNLTVKAFTTLDGLNISKTTDMHLASNTGLYRKYTSRATGLNHSLLFMGAFHIHSLELKVFDAGTVR